MDTKITLDDKYTARSGHVFLNGTQALVRLPMTQMRRDRASGLNTATFISGYRGSPLGNYDQQLLQAKKHLKPLHIDFQPGVNEDLAATAVWGSQQVSLSGGANREGVLGIWYGKGPGVDRSGDVLKHANAAGTSAQGGVLAIAGDDHTCKSSSIPHQSDHTFISALIPMLYPSSVQEFLEYGLLGIAMSRFSGCWVGFKVISDTVETTTTIDLVQEQRQFVLPEDFELPPGGLNLRWPDSSLEQDERLQEHKAYAALAFARANAVNATTINTPNARFGIVASGKAYEDVLQALSELGIDQTAIETIGLRLYKVRMPWPLEPEGIRHFSEGLQEVLIIEERREIIENQIKQQLFNWRSDVRPRIIGKFDHEEKPFLSLSKGLTVSAVARAIADRILHLPLPESLFRQISDKLHFLEEHRRLREQHHSPVTRLPYYCAGCPHNTSTRVPEGSQAMAGIGCHFMAQWMDRRTSTFTHMGAEGVPWTAISRYTTEKHRFVNLGDGTYFHSGLMAIRQSVASGVNITYKILYNDAVAMTGGQPIDGQLTPQQLTHQLFHEGVKTIYLLSDKPEYYHRSELPPGVVIRYRDAIDVVMRSLREITGTTAIVYEQTCAAEKRRRRKRGILEDPDQRVFINTAVCEGCGDCSKQSNCIAIEPWETTWGRKRQINQSSCNKDFSCLKGFCPALVTLRGAQPKKQSQQAEPDIHNLPSPVLPDIQQEAWNIAVAGVGGTGVLTIGAVLGMAAHIEGKTPLVMDMTGLAQKGGAVLSHIRLSTRERPATSPHIINGGADLILAADTVVAASTAGLILCHTEKTQAIVNTRMTPVAAFVQQGDFDFQQQALEKIIADRVKPHPHFHNFSHLAAALMGNEIFANIMMLGYACQSAYIPVQLTAIEQAIKLNGVAIQKNLRAFRWGRLLAHDTKQVTSLLPQTQHSQKTLAEMSLQELIQHRQNHLIAYQDNALAERYKQQLENFQKICQDKIDPQTQTDLLRCIAENYAKLLAYKDEYEIARLLTASGFQKKLDHTFSGAYRLSYHLAPPFLPGKDWNGRPKKREFGPWIYPVFKTLARLKHLRGGAFDVFGYTHERKAERALIQDYEADIQWVLQHLQTHNSAIATQLLALPEQIRGFGPVKLANMQDAARQRQILRKQLSHTQAANSSKPIQLHKMTAAQMD